MIFGQERFSKSNSSEAVHELLVESTGAPGTGWVTWGPGWKAEVGLRAERTEAPVGLAVSGEAPRQ